MSYLPHIWVYAGATCEDVYEALDDKASDRTNLDIMSTPQLAFVATDYSDDLVQKLAMDMWSEIQGDYEESFERGISFHELTAVMSAQVVERPEGYEGEMPVLEVTIWHYYLMHSVEPLMQVVIQKRPLRRLSTFEASA
jgi:hypothetical protein